jgi:hypothetical protein
MSANTYLQLTELDFNEIRDNLKNYLSTQTQFKDYNFEGSAMAVLLDVLAYNTHYNAYYANMLANEMFLDTAQQRDSVVSFAKALGYTPSPAIGARATVRLTFTGVDTSIPEFILNSGAKFTTTIDDVAYTFVTPQAYNVVNVNGQFKVDVIIKEGTPVTHRFVVNSSNQQRYILPNQNVDTSSLFVRVQDSLVDTTTEEFVRASNVRQVFKTSPIYFLEEAFDGKYELVFGSGGLGKELLNGNVIIADYLVCNAGITNGADIFSIESITTSIPYTNVQIEVIKPAIGGHDNETIESIKFNAPRNYQTQNRAVVSEDYQRIILNENPDLQSVVAFGGEEADPPIYGKVLIAAKPFGEQFITQNRKMQIKESILDRTPLAIDPLFVDAKYTYIIPTVTTYYSKTKTVISPAQIVNSVRQAVGLFSQNNLERFGNRLRYSKFIRALDDIGIGEILNNDVSIIIENRFVPNTQRTERVIIDFNNALRRNTISSTQFIFRGFLCNLDDDGLGNIQLYRFNDLRQKIYVNRELGTVNYSTGRIILNNFAPTAIIGIELKVNAQPLQFEIIPIREQILIIDPLDAIINTIGEAT